MKIIQKEISDDISIYGVLEIHNSHDMIILSLVIF